MRRKRREIITLYNALENLGRSDLNQIEADIIVWYTKRDPYNMLIGLLIASSSTLHASSAAPQWLLINFSKTLHNEADKGDPRFSRHFFNEHGIDVEVYIFPPFFEIVDRMCIGIYFKSEGISPKTGCDVIQHGQPDTGSSDMADSLNPQVEVLKNKRAAHCHLRPSSMTPHAYSGPPHASSMIPQ